MIDEDSFSDSDKDNLKNGMGLKKPVLIGIVIAIAAVVVVVAVVVVLVVSSNDKKDKEPDPTPTNPTQTPTAPFEIKNFDKGGKISFNDIRMYQVYTSAFRHGEGGADGFQKSGGCYGPSDCTANLKGITEALDYIKDLGMNAIWLTPFLESNIKESKNYAKTRLESTGYYATNFFKVDSRLGTNDDFKDLVKKAHEKGIYVFMDAVLGHCGNTVSPSPKGATASVNSKAEITAESGNIRYPESLDFFYEFFDFWINGFEVDGFRFDQADQLYNGKRDNYWRYIRVHVENIYQKRRNEGKEWGTLGYITSEIWKSDEEIVKVMNNYGLFGALDFQSRYRLVKSTACQEYSKEYGYSPKTTDSFKEMENFFINKDIYTNNNNLKIKDTSITRTFYLNAFITSHDLKRYGNLMNQNCDKADKGQYCAEYDSEDYWRRHKLALALLAAYGGPITIYYGDEYGAYTPPYSGSDHIAADNEARTNGRIDGFTVNEQNLVDYTRKLLNLRVNYSLSQPITYYFGTGSYGFAVKGDVIIGFNTDNKDKTIKQTELSGYSSVIDLITNEPFDLSGEFTLKQGRCYYFKKAT